MVRELIEYKIKKKKNSSRSLGNMEGKKGGNEVAKQRIDEKNRRKEARDVAREGTQSNPLLFIQ